MELVNPDFDRGRNSGIVSKNQLPRTRKTAKKAPPGELTSITPPHTNHTSSTLWMACQGETLLVNYGPKHQIVSQSFARRKPHLGREGGRASAGRRWVGTHLVDGGYNLEQFVVGEVLERELPLRHVPGVRFPEHGVAVARDHLTRTIDINGRGRRCCLCPLDRDSRKGGGGGRGGDLCHEEKVDFFHIQLLPIRDKKISLRSGPWDITRRVGDRRDARPHTR